MKKIEALFKKISNFLIRKKSKKVEIRPATELHSNKKGLVIICPVCHKSNELDGKGTLYINYHLGTCHCDYCGWGIKMKHLRNDELKKNVDSIDPSEMDKTGKFGFYICDIGTEDEYSSNLYLSPSMALQYGMKTAMIWAELTDRYERLMKKNKIGADDFFPYSFRDLQRETSVGHSAQKTCVDKLVHDGLLEVKSVGNSNVRYFRILSEDQSDDSKYYAVRKIFLSVFSLPQHAVFFSALLWKYKGLKNNNLFKKAGFCPYSPQAMKELTGLSKEKQLSSINILRSENLISINDDRNIVKINFNSEFLKDLHGYRIYNGNIIQMQ